MFKALSIPAQSCFCVHQEKLSLPACGYFFSFSKNNSDFDRHSAVLPVRKIPNRLNLKRIVPPIPIRVGLNFIWVFVSTTKYV